MNIGKIVNAAEEANFSITNFKMAKLSKADAEKLLEAHRAKPYFNDLANHLASDLVVALEVLAENCLAKVKDFVGSVRGQFGSDAIRGAVYGS